MCHKYVTYINVQSQNGSIEQSNLGPFEQAIFAAFDVFRCCQLFGRRRLAICHFPLRHCIAYSFLQTQNSEGRFKVEPINLLSGTNVCR